MGEPIISKSVYRRLQEQICYKCRHYNKDEDTEKRCKLDQKPNSCDKYEYDG